jgi:hypothetical protein
MKKRIYRNSIYVMAGLLFLLLGCKEEKGWTLMEDDQTKPGLGTASLRREWLWTGNHTL